MVGMAAGAPRRYLARARHAPGTSMRSCRAFFRRAGGLRPASSAARKPMIQFRHPYSATGQQAQSAPQEGQPLFNGIESTRFTSLPAFKDSVGEFEVLQQLNKDGSLVEGIELPFSLDTAVQMYRTMVASSVYDTILMELQRQGRISFYCSNFGEEATAVGSAAALSGDDMVWPHYRELGMFLWRGLSAQQIVDQNLGNEDDVGKGRNLQVHYCLPDANVQTVHAILGTHICQAPGAGYGYRLEGEDKVSVAYFGDGAASEGDALTALNFASVYKSQTLFICRNNGYSISTPVSDQYGGDGIAARGPAFGIPSIRVDGNDVVAVFNATKAARELAVREKTPVLIELMTYRLSHHTTSDDSSLYRPEGERERFESAAPMLRLRALLEREGRWDEDMEAQAQKAARKEMLAAIATGEEKLKGPVVDLFTDTFAEMPWHLKEQRAMLETHMREYADDYSLEKYRGAADPVPTEALQTPSSAPTSDVVVTAPMDWSSFGPTTHQNMYQAINSAMDIALASDSKTLLFGEDVGFGGVFRCSEGLRDKHGADRVFNAPVAEQAIAGFAIGLGVTGYTPIAEMQFADYIFPAFDQIVNELAKYRYRTGGTISAGAITIRAPCSSVGHGSMYHSQSVESYFAHCPGLKIVIPSGPAEAKGLLLAAIRDPDPVLFFEPKMLYRNSEGEVPVGDYELPIGQANVKRSGEDITLVGWGTQVARMEEAADRVLKEDGVSCEIIDLQTIIPWDVDTVTASVAKTGRLVVTHEACSTGGFGAEIAAKVEERCFLSLEAPTQRVVGFDTHWPYAWDEFAVPGPARLVDAIRKSIAY